MSRQRLRWWLRSERALGLGFVHAPGGGLLSAEPPRQASGHRGNLSDETPGVDTPAALDQRRSQRGRPARAELDQALRIATPQAQSLPPQAQSLPPQAQSLTVISPVQGPPTEPFTSPELSAIQKAAALVDLNEKSVVGCQKCGLGGTRRNTVFGEGNPDARLVFVGEGPGSTEDQTGRPFVGRAGQKLDEMIRAMGYSRDDLYICNVVKCRAFIPPAGKDRPPLPEEVSACMPYLQRQIEIIRPRVMVTLGLSASHSLLSVKDPMSRMRGRWTSWRGIPVMPTFHPSYILRNYTTEIRRAVWEDLKQVKSKLEAATR